jgi:hypothetical protein
MPAGLDSAAPPPPPLKLTMRGIVRRRSPPEQGVPAMLNIETNGHHQRTA